MARSRMVKPEFWDDERLASISFQARLTYIGIWNFCDDYGVTKANPLWLKSRIFPYDDKISMKEFEKWLSELRKLKRVIEFRVNEEPFFYLPKFLKHQVINRPSASRYPDPKDYINKDSLSTHGILTSEIEIEVKEKEKENINTSPDGSVINTHGVVNANGDGFEQFWKAYPKKRAKGDCLEIWKKLKRKKTLPEISRILDAIESQKHERANLKNIGAFCPEWKDPERWLKKGCWDDEPQEQRASDDCPGFDWSKP